MDMEHAARILLVDDDPDLLKLLSIRLQAEGYELECAADTAQALTQLGSFQIGRAHV
jgi:two-component system response regulator GlrR